MEITPRELRDIEIRESLRGYNRDEVNELLERAAATIELLNDRVRQLNERINAVASDSGRSRETEDILHRTLLLAQRAADDAIAEAQQKARQLVEDSEAQSRRVLAEAEGEARRRGETELRRIEQDMVDLAARREVLLSDVEALVRYETDYRDRVVKALEADLEAWRARPKLSPGPKPEVSDVPLPVSPEGVMRRDTEPDVDPRTEQVDVRAFFEAQQAAAALVESGAVPEHPAEPVATPPAAAPPVDAPPFEMAVPDTAPAAAPTMDFGTEEAVEARVMDDDAFFASLRDAVRDNEPLGPRDDAGSELFDQDDDEEHAGFREMFRRRR